MVGASRGGILVRLFQTEDPADVAGLVLIGPTPEDQLFVMFEGKGPDRNLIASMPPTVNAETNQSTDTLSRPSSSLSRSSCESLYPERPYP